MFRLFDLFKQTGYDLYLVGGAVRDHLLGMALEDLVDVDFATSALPAESARILRAAGLPVFTVGSRFGTVGTVLEDGGFRKEVQVTTFRGEIYINGSRKPRVSFGKDLEVDLSRRDFSINAMAMTRDRRLVDPYGGEKDLEQRVLRTVGDPHTIFREDPLRTLRAARFIATLGMHPEPEVTRIVRELADEILTVSRERWLIEMNKLLPGVTVELALGFLADTGLLARLLPEAQAMVEFKAGQGRHHHKALWPHTTAVVGQAPARVAVRWAALLHDAGKVTTRSVDAAGEVHFFGHEAVGASLVDDVARRFRFPQALHQQVHTMVLMHQRPALYEHGWTDGAVRRLIRDAGDVLTDLLDLSRADVTSHRPGVREAVLERLAELEARTAELREKDGQGPLLPKGIGLAIMQHFGLGAGPQVGELKGCLEQAVLDGELPRDGAAPEYLAYLDRVRG
ncbi:MAG TPA: HD domain-containing protein [Candidatus Methylomirabilis sp.]|nr:HD domain-containing protein [Candidatus Methylomirabilis sp.]